MTKAPPRDRHRKARQKQHVKSKDTPKGHGKHLAVLAIIALLAGIPFTMGKYIEFNTPGPYDSGGYVYSAKHILEGAVIGVDERPSAQIVTLLVNMLGVWLFGFNETGPEIIQMICQAGALILMFVMMRKLFGMLPAAVGVIIASCYLSAPLIAKFGNVKEQYMIAFMMLGVSFFVLRQLGGRWYYAALAGALLSWAPLFKPTGVSAVGAVGLFLIAQPFFKHRNWKQTFTDIGLLAAGAVVVIAPIYVWVLASGGRGYLPYSFVWKPVVSAISGAGQANQSETPAAEEPQVPEQKQAKKKGLLRKILPGYVTGSWDVLKPEQKKQVVHRVFRYYLVLLLPIVLALVSIVARLLRLVWRRAGAASSEKMKTCDRFVLLFAMWWLFDMALIWVSPRSYEQYYLPLNASAAMLSGYIVALYGNRLSTAVHKQKWVAVGLAGLVLMLIMSWHIFFGVKKSPHSNTIYKNQRTGRPERRRGYIQKLDDARWYSRNRGRSTWEAAAQYIRLHSDQTDRIYVWGWEPGIYVAAQRLGAASKAGEATMHTVSPEVLSKKVDQLLTEFGKRPPKFVVDTHKVHFPWDRPPLELWPRTRNGFLPNDKAAIRQYDQAYSQMLRERNGEDEALRYQAMRPFREYIMNNYKIVNRSFGQHVLFERE